MMTDVLQGIKKNTFIDILRVDDVGSSASLRIKEAKGGKPACLYIAHAGISGFFTKAWENFRIALKDLGGGRNELKEKVQARNQSAIDAYQKVFEKESSICHTDLNSRDNKIGLRVENVQNAIIKFAVVSHKGCKLGNDKEAKLGSYAKFMSGVVNEYSVNNFKARDLDTLLDFIHDGNSKKRRLEKRLRNENVDYSALVGKIDAFTNLQIVEICLKRIEDRTTVLSKKPKSDSSQRELDDLEAIHAKFKDLKEGKIHDWALQNEMKMAEKAFANFNPGGRQLFESDDLRLTCELFTVCRKQKPESKNPQPFKKNSLVTWENYL